MKNKPLSRAVQSQKIQALKRRWARNNKSPFAFFITFYSWRSMMTYNELLELINFHERVTPELEAAIREFKRVSV